MSELVTFKDLWDNHPDIAGGEHNPCSPDFTNQCAIRMGISLAKAGVDTTKLSGINYKGNMAGIEHCWHGHPSSAGHIFRSEDLARALEHTHIQGVQKIQKVTVEDFHKTISGKTGIIFFKDYWRRKNESFRNKSGDHIDLWNGSRLTSVSSWARIHMHMSWEGSYSDFFNSKEIWFWGVN